MPKERVALGMLCIGVALSVLAVEALGGARGLLPPPAAIAALTLLALSCWSRPRSFLARGALAVALVVVSFSVVFTAVIEMNRRTEERARRVAERARVLGAGAVVRLGDQSSTVLRMGPDGTATMDVEVEAGMILEAAVGVDPMIRELSAPRCSFFVELVEEGKGPRRLWSTEVEPAASPSAVGVWLELAVSLDDVGPGPVVLRFGRSVDADGDLPEGAAALALWRRPRVRPRSLPEIPNVVLVSIDTLRGDHVGYSGYGRNTTPALDALAAGGVAFATTVSQAPWTRPSHFSIFTSQIPSHHGADAPVQSWKRPGERWPDAAPDSAARAGRSQRRLPSATTAFLPEILQAAGMRTAAFTAGAAVSARLGFARGFDVYDENRCHGKCCNEVAETFRRADAWLAAQKGASFFAFVHTYQPHSPYCDRRFADAEAIDAADTVALRTALYDGDIALTDEYLGHLVDGLRRRGQLERTIVVVTSDHGEDLGGRQPPEASVQLEHGHNLYDELLLVPLVFAGPGLPAGVVVDEQVRSMDIAPTVLELLGLPLPEQFEGRSLAGLLRGAADAHRPAVSEATTFGPSRRSLRAQGFKLVERLSDVARAHPDDVSGMPLTPLYELYDLRVDPTERNNLAASAPDRVAAMAAQLDALAPPLAEAAPRGPGVEMDPELMELLRSLGYLN